MDRLDMLRTFVAVADVSSFAEGARRRRISATAASRAIAALEADLGTALLYRTTRSVRLTEAGSTYLLRARAALAELEDAALQLKGEVAAPGGTMVITAPVMFGRLHILPVVTQLLIDHNALSVRMLLVDRFVRLAEEGVDIAVRIGDLADSALHAVKLGEVRLRMAASPDFLAREGVPSSPNDLRHRCLISFIGMDSGREWRFGDGSTVRIEPRLTVNTADAAIAAAEQGMGIARVLSYQVADSIAAGRLVPVLEDAGPASVPVHLLYQPNRRNHPNVRAFVNAARARMATLPEGALM
jgi:DNA-binding transcriptional LysR family regulator